MQPGWVQGIVAQLSMGCYSASPEDVGIERLIVQGNGFCTGVWQVMQTGLMAGLPSLLVVNSLAREVAAKPRLPQEMLACLRSHGVEADLRVTTRIGEGTKVVREAVARGCERVVVAGGDGSVNEVLNGLGGADVPIGLIPLGTGNALARFIGLEPGDIQTACQIVAYGQVRRLDMGVINGRLFANMAGVGLDAQVASQVESAWKTRLGAYAFVTQFLQTVAELRPWRFEAKLDGEPLSGKMWAMFVCNSPQYTWRVRMVPEARPDDGELDFVLVRACSRPQLLAAATKVFIGGRSAVGMRHMEVLRGKRLELRTDPPAPWQVDGDVGGRTPVACEVKSSALSLIVPPAPGP